MDSGECECVLHRNGTLIFEMICKLFRSHCTTRPTQHFPFFNVIVCSTHPSIAQHSPRNSFDLNLHRDFSESLIPSLISLHESRAKMMLRRRQFRLTPHRPIDDTFSQMNEEGRQTNMSKLLPLPSLERRHSGSRVRMSQLNCRRAV